ncbi:RNA polymerase-binding ATPase [Motiliproteus sp. MSK22-1]|nr:RNA polymerase-binding ATPase [Motiliproteus sp. MSK22-1]
MTPLFVPGQRWVSNTESELGLGIVADIANRRVTISFPAVGEERVYAANNAPLSRIEYAVGEEVLSADGLSIEVNGREEINGYYIYSGVCSEGKQHRIEEIDLDSFVHFNKPQDRLFAGQIDKNSRFQLRVDTLNYIHRLQQSEAYGLLGPRVQLLPHQFYIAHQVSRRHAPRVLLADEVGLGKTIEAGLILHQHLVSGRAERVLVVVPDSLIHQWLVEMLRRFNLHFSILDEDRCQALLEAGEGNPFESAQLVLCTLSMMTESDQAREFALQADWDLLVVDEAHHLIWSDEEVSPAYKCIEALSREVPGVLLLTATPEQLGIESHFARLRLLDPDRYYDLQQFHEEEASYRPVNQLVQCLLSQDAVDQFIRQPAVADQIELYLGSETLRTLRSQLLSAESDKEERKAINDVIYELLDRHGTGRVLFRNTRSAVEGFPVRRLTSYALPQTETYPELLLDADLEDQLHPERLFGESWLAVDARVSWLSDFLTEMRDEKVLVICAQAGTARSLEEHLRLRVGLRSAVFHEGLSLVARDRAAAYFAEREQGAQVLICSEIGSEGRNFQFSHDLVLFDLPLNPDLLEQRIGRLDRIGQQRDINIHVPYYRDSAQDGLMRWHHEGLNAFLTPSPAGQSLYEAFVDRLVECLSRQNDPAGLEQLIKDTRQLNDAALETMSQGRDRLLELNSCKQDEAEVILDQLTEASNFRELSNYMERVFDQFGVEQQHHSTNAIVLTPGDHMHMHSFPGLSEDGATATYSRTLALHREDMQFLTWEHPMVSGAMEMIAEGEFGNTALCTIKLPPIKPGTLMLEAIFSIHCPAPKKLQLQRYLPHASIRVLVDVEGNDLSAVLADHHVNQLAKRVAKGTAPNIVRLARDQIGDMISRADAIASGQQPLIVDEAIANMSEVLGAEMARLKALSEVNPNIREEEVKYLEDLTVSLAEYLEGAQVQLDAIRVILAT